MGYSALVALLLVIGSAIGTDGLGTGISVTSSRTLKELAVSVARESWIGEISGEPGKEFGECGLKTTFPPASSRGVTSECEKGLSCIPILTTPTSISRRNLLERAGVCVQFPKENEINGKAKPSSAYIFDSLNPIPTPLGYFPLTYGNVNSWPFPTYEGELQGQKFVDDKEFGSVLKCSENTVKLPSIPYASTGELAINFWAKAGAPGKGIGFEYLFSHMKSGALPGLGGDSQIQIYLPRKPLPAHGVVRAVVKDSNDEDKGESSNVFVDSDGEVGNNSKRDFDKTHPNIYDDKWHMITVSSKMNREKGFLLFVDGELAGELGEGTTSKSTNGETEFQVTGGDPIDLDGEIHLCGRAEDSTDRYFEGSLAHLSLFNSPLSIEDVKNMYELLLSTPVQVDGMENTDDATLARSGSPCLFPAIFRGEVVEECVPLANTQECPTGAGLWEECDFFASEHDDNFQFSENGKKPAGTFVTVDGDTCELPVYYAGILRHECIDIYGVPSCRTRGGVWKECAESAANVEKEEKAKAKRTTIYGKDCILPFEYMGESYDDCTMISDSWSCRVPAGDFEPCAVVRDPQTVYGVNSSAAVLGRVTKSGESCFFPYWYGDTSVADCFPSGDIPSCPVVGGEILECAHPRITISGQPCALPFFHDGESHSDCVDVGEQSYCRTPDGEFEQCAPTNSVVEPYVLNPQMRVLTSRATIDEDNCMFPFWYQGKLVSKCVEEEGGEFCRTAGGLWKECAQQRMTTDGRECSIPFQHEGEFMWDCIYLDGEFQCPTAEEEPWGACIGDFEYPPGAEPDAESDEDLEEAVDADSVAAEDLGEEETLEGER